MSSLTNLRMFPGFMSRWTILFSLKYLRAEAKLQNQRETFVKFINIVNIY